MVRVVTLWNEIENPNWSETGRRKGEEENEDEDDVAPLSSNGKSITIAPPTTTTFPSPIPLGATATETTIPLPWPSSIRESDHNDVFNFCRRWCEGVRVWTFGVWTFRCKWEWEWDCVLVRVRVKRDLKFRCQCQVPRWNRKMGYLNSPSSSTTKSGTFLYISQTMFRA